jgi:hypothetical protein
MQFSQSLLRQRSALVVRTLLRLMSTSAALLCFLHNIHAPDIQLLLCGMYMQHRLWKEQPLLPLLWQWPQSSASAQHHVRQ